MEKLRAHCELPLSQPRFIPEELRGLADTTLRFVIYYGASFDTCFRRGHLNDNPQKIRARPPGTTTDNTSARVLRGECRVASCDTIFWNMIHEGFVFLSSMVNKKMYLNKESSKCLKFTEGEVIIASMFYSNDVLVVFAACLQSFELQESAEYVQFARAC